MRNPYQYSNLLPLTIATLTLCENCVTECRTVVMSTAFAMDVPPVSFNNFSYL